MENYENEKIRIPNETYCPSKKSQFNYLLSNNITTVPSQANNNNNIPNIGITNPFFNNNINNNNSSSSPTKLISNTNTNLNINFLSQDNSSEEGVTISPIKSIITSASSKPLTIIEPQCKLEKFLPPKTSKCQKTLVLDLDETLIHSYFDCSSPRKPDLSYDIFIENKKIHVDSIVRPGAGEFLESVSGLFEIVVFTASLSEYANPLLDFIDKNKKCKHRLYREHCCSFNNGFTNSFTKDLKKLDRNMKNLIIIDNNPKSYMLNKDNGVPIKTWVEDVNDRELYKIIPYLIFLGSEKVKDVRPFLKQVNSGNSLNYDKFDKIISKYNNDNTNEKTNKINKSNNNNCNILDNNENNKNSLINKENKNLNINPVIIPNPSNSGSNTNTTKNKETAKIYNNYISKENKNKNNDDINKSQKDNSNNSSQNKLYKVNNDNNNKNPKDNNKSKMKPEKEEQHNKKLNDNSNSNSNLDNEKNNKKIENIKNKGINLISNNLNFSNKGSIKQNKNLENQNNKSNEKSKEIKLRDLNNINNKENKEKENKEKENNRNNSNNYFKQKRRSPKKDKTKSNNNSNSIGNNILTQRNNSLNNKNYYRNKLNEIPYRIKYNNNKIYLNNRYENIFKEDDILEIEEYHKKEMKNHNNFGYNSAQVIPFNGLSRKFLGNQSINVRNEKNSKDVNINPNNLNIHTAKSTSNINKLTKTGNYLNKFNKNVTENMLIEKENEILNKVKKAINIDNINNIPTSEILEQCITNLNKANSLKGDYNNNYYSQKIQNAQLSDENLEKTIINDDMEEEEKSDNKNNNHNKEKEVYEQLFDDIDAEKDEVDINQVENKKKCFEADDAVEFNHNLQKEKIIDEIIDVNKNESNTINTKSSLLKKNRIINNNYFNKSKQYPINNNNNNKSNNKKEVLPSNNNKDTKVNNNSSGIQYQPYFKKGASSSNYNFLHHPKKMLPKELFNYSTRKKNEKNPTNLSSSNFHIFKEKAKMSLYLKKNTNTNVNNNDSFHNSNNIFHIKNSQFNTKTNRNKDTSNTENHKISLVKSSNIGNNIKNIKGLKSSHKKYFILKNKISNNNSDKKNFVFSNRGSNSLSTGSGPKIRRPTSCANRESEKIFYSTNENKNGIKKTKVINFSNQGKKIYLRIDNKNNINTENINNININLDDFLNNSNVNKEDKNNKNDELKEITKQLNSASFSPNNNSPSPSGNIVTDILFKRNVGPKNLKTTKGILKDNFFNSSQNKDLKKKRYPSAVNNKLLKNNSNNKLL